MILVFDVGNTNIVLGVYREKEMVTSWRISTDRHKTADEYGMLLKQLLKQEGHNLEDMKAVVMSSVVPPLMYSLQHAVNKYCKVSPLIIGPGIKTGINIRYDNPKEVGADRIVNAVAAHEKYGGPVIIVDFGTATTFCAVSEKGEYLGGTIAPGIRISSEALFERASKLPRVELVKPGRFICKNTVNSMQAGIIYGYVGLVDHIVKNAKRELKWENAKIVATGGFSRLIASESETIDIVDGFLTLDGLRIIYDRNSERKGD